MSLCKKISRDYSIVCTFKPAEVKVSFVMPLLLHLGCAWDVPYAGSGQQETMSRVKGCEVERCLVGCAWAAVYVWTFSEQRFSIYLGRSDHCNPMRLFFLAVDAHRPTIDWGDAL